MYRIAITNSLDLYEKNADAFEAIYHGTVGDAYTLKDIIEALDRQGPNPDMSEYSYHPVLTGQQAEGIEKRFGVSLRKATVKARPDVSPKMYELTHVSPRLGYKGGKHAIYIPTTG